MAGTSPIPDPQPQGLPPSTSPYGDDTHRSEGQQARNSHSGGVSVREHVCCQQCSKPETAGERMLKCGGCKFMTYCSVACQKEHWKRHRKTCQATRAIVDQAKEVHGKGVIKSKHKWVLESRDWLAGLIHTLLGDRTRTHVVHVVTEYQPGSKPEFKIIRYSVLTLQEVQERSPPIYESIRKELGLLPKLLEEHGARVGAMGIGVFTGESPALTVPFALGSPGYVQDVVQRMIRMGPERIVERINNGDVGLLRPVPR